jgi:hypothetical protein
MILCAGMRTMMVHTHCTCIAAANLLFSTRGTPARLTSIAAAVFAPCKT